MSITASTPSKRIALAPVDTNVKSPLNKTVALNPLRSSNRFISLPRTSTCLSPRLQSIRHNINPSIKTNPLIRQQRLTGTSWKSSTFSDYKISNTKNATVDLAATKLKLKLQLAFYKVQQQYKRRQFKTANIKDATRHMTVEKSSTKSANSTANSTPNSFVMDNSLIGTLTPPSPSNNYQESANLNLRTKTKTLPIISQQSKSKQSSTKPSLSSIASNKYLPKLQNLKLFQIKKTSSFYNSIKTLPTSKLPFLESDIVQQPSLKLSKPNFNNSLNVRDRSLPSINKILKTPMKTTSSTRNLIYNKNDPSTQSATNNINTDETIDESTMDESSLAISVKRKDNLLSSSPIRENAFGTPNSFSVAKSLLQLGSGYY